MASRACPTCGLLHLDGPNPRACYYDAQLKPAVEGLDLTEDEDRILRWLAQSDKPTVDAVVSIIRKAREPKAHRRRHEKAEPPRTPCSVCGGLTDWLCADCAIDGRGKVALCMGTACVEAHERETGEAGR